MTPTLDRRATGLVVLAVAFIASLTLYPTGGKPPFEPWCITCGATLGVDSVLNVLLFAPLGFALERRRTRLWVAVLAGFALSASIELTQNWIPGRDPSLRDLLCNTLGAALGWWLAYHRRQLLLPSARHARALAVSAGLGWVGLHAAGDWLGLPALPKEPYTVGYIGTMDEFQYFPGRVLEKGIAFNDAIITLDSVPRFESIIRGGWFERGAIKVSSPVIPAPGETKKLAPIIGVADAHRRQIFLVGQLGSTLVFRLRSNANAARLRGYLFELDRAFPGRPGAVGVAGDTLVVVTERRRGEIRLTARTRDREHVWIHRLGPALVWTHFLFFDLPIGPVTDVGTVLWLFCSLVPVAYWAAAGNGWRERGTRRGTVITIALLALLPVLALGLFARAFSIGAAPLGEWVASAAGLATGWWLWKRASRLRDPYRSTRQSPGGADQFANSLLREERPKDNSLLSRRRGG